MTARRVCYGGESTHPWEVRGELMQVFERQLSSQQVVSAFQTSHLEWMQVGRGVRPCAWSAGARCGMSEQNGKDGSNVRSAMGGLNVPSEKDRLSDLSAKGEHSFRL